LEKSLCVTGPEPLLTPKIVYRHRTDSGTTNTLALPRALFCEVVKPLPKREVVTDAPKLLWLYPGHPPKRRVAGMVHSR
jgi:hypothetical protein